MAAILENILDNITNLEHEQLKVVAYICELEIRRSQLLSFVGSLTEDMLTNRGKQTLSDKICRMALVVDYTKSDEGKKNRIQTDKKDADIIMQDIVKWDSIASIYIQTKFANNFWCLENVQNTNMSTSTS